MPPTRSRPLRAGDVWLDDSLWSDAPARRTADHEDETTALFDHEREPRTTPRRTRDRRDEQPRRAADERARRGEHDTRDHEVERPRRGEHDRPAAERPRRTLERTPRPYAAAEDLPEPEAVDPFADTDLDAADDAPAGEVPGLLRRPLVEIQRTVPTAERRRPGTPDRMALWAVALAVLVLVSAIITAS
jgi:hypothetical protein